MEKLKSTKKVIVFHVLLNIAIIVFITGASYYHTPLNGFKDTLVYVIHLLLLQCTIAGFFYLLSLFKQLFKFVFPFLFMFYCTFSFWAYSQDISVTEQLIQAVFETKPDIAIDLITWPYVLFLGTALFVVIGLLRLYAKIEPRKTYKGIIVIAVLGVALFPILEKVRPGSLKNRIPYTVIFGIKSYFEKPELLLNTTIDPRFTQNDSIIFVFVLGETVRADHLGVNGYARNTTPQISKDSNWVSFPKLYTKHTYTGASVPQLLTNQTLATNDGVFTSIFTVANAATYTTTWIGNQTLEKSFSSIVATNSNVDLIDQYKSEFSFHKALDEALLLPFSNQLNKGPKQFITLHMLGSHWWYENRYTDTYRKFRPVIDSKYIPSLSAEQIINSYDNTLLYLDSFLHQTTSILNKQPYPTVLLYVSDHGELLGEDGKWLHAQSGKAATNPGFLLWFSDRYTTKFPERVNEYKSIKEDSLTTDKIYPFVLDLLDIQ